jgi:hypothetical protein
MNAVTAMQAIMLIAIAKSSHCVSDFMSADRKSPGKNAGAKLTRGWNSRKRLFTSPVCLTQRWAQGERIPEQKSPVLSHRASLGSELAGKISEPACASHALGKGRSGGHMRAGSGKRGCMAHQTIKKYPAVTKGEPLS